MPIIHIDANQDSTYEISGDADVYILDPGKSIYSPLSSAIHLAAGATGNQLEIRGMVGTSTTAPAILVEGDDTRLVIAASGFVGAAHGVELDNVSCDIVNRGTVSTDETGFVLSESAGRLVNHGHITTGSFGTAVAQSTSVGSFTLVNQGVIAGSLALQLEAPELVVKLGEASEIQGVIGILLDSAAGHTATTVNRGLIATSAGYAYNNAGGGKDIIINRGTIYGDIFLGAGDDQFTDKGKFVGEVHGGAGDDTFILRRAVEVTEFSSGGTDTIRIGKSFSLAENIENLSALGGGNVVLTGNDESNVIKGNRGDNRIEGGASVDTLTGGGGKDLFVYAKFDGMDTITDFKHGQDRVRIEGFTQYTSFADLEIEKSGNDVRISFADENGADFITVENQKVGDFDRSDFLFG